MLSDKGISAFGQTMENVADTQSKPQWQQRANEEKVTAVHNEMQRINQLPPNSSYVTHRLRVLKKVLELLSMQVKQNLEKVIGHYNNSILNQKTETVVCI